MRVACTSRSLWTAALRSLGAMLILVALLVPGLASALMSDSGSGPVVAPRSPAAGHLEDGLEDGACGEDQEIFEELIDCGAELDARLDEPLAIALLRTTEVRMTSQQCEELIADIWSRQSCSLTGRECGDVYAGGIVPSGLELASSSTSGHVSALPDAVAAARVRRLGRPLDERMPRLPDLSPPVPPPKLVLR